MPHALSRRTVTTALASTACGCVLPPAPASAMCLASKFTGISPAIERARDDWNEALAAYHRGFTATFTDPATGAWRGFAHLEEPRAIAFGLHLQRLVLATRKLISASARSKADVTVKLWVLEQIFGPSNVVRCHWLKPQLPAFTAAVQPEAQRFDLALNPQWHADLQAFIEQDDELMWQDWHFWYDIPHFAT